MYRYNKGVIFTNDNCIGCNRCISNCSLIGANVSVFKDGVAHMEIDSRKCNDCGRCISVCVHNARDFRDDTEAFFADLAKGVKISVVLAPAFFSLYGERAEGIIGCLRSLGVDKIYDGGYGREISVYLTTKYLKETRDLPINERRFISNACPALVTVIQKYHPFLIGKLIPVQPASVCSAIYAHKYLGDTNKIAYLSSCVASKDEVDSENTGGNLNYNITFVRVMEKIAQYNFDDYKEQGTLDLTATGFGSLTGKGGDFSDLVSHFFSPVDNILPFKGFAEKTMQSLYYFFHEEYKEIHPILAEITACPSGCISGPGHDQNTFDIKTVYSNINNIRRRVFESCKELENPDKLWKKVSSQFKYIRPDDFQRNYTDYSCQKFKVPKSAIDEIFADMLKNTPQKRNINCRSCGYSGCNEMVRAIAFGYSRKENCIHYMNDLMLKRLNTDSDTGLMSPSSFHREGDILLSQNPEKNYIIAVGDVNKLKIINDLYDFPTGTAVLQQIAATLRQIAGEEGLVARLGGGCFALCMENTVDNLQRLQSCKIFDCTSLDINFPVTMHFGIRIANAQIGLGRAMTQASLCMNNNISSIQNTYSAFTEKNLERTYLETELTSKMQQALKNGEFKIWFQPQYSAATNKLVGAEALCRWIESDGNIISPSLFIPVAEKNGFIRFLDEEIWVNVFAAVRSWIDAGIEPVPISINISRVSLETDKIYYVIKRLKEKFSIDEKYIHFEITETASLSSEPMINARIQKLRELGFYIAMDDFGCGYSSLNSLKDMPIDILKLDMGFMQGDDNLNRGGTIINYVVRMAQGLEYITVAEGVETQEQADFLRSIGVNVFQGFLFAQPLPEDQFLKILKSTDRQPNIIRPRTFGQIDVRQFLTPDSSESLMFEEYTGPAAIFEYDDKTENLTLVRANYKYLRLFEVEELSFADARKSIKNLIGKSSAAEMVRSIKESIKENREVTCNYEVRTYVKHNPVWIKNHLWQISHNGAKHSLYLLAEDITNEKITESTLELSNNQLAMMMENTQVGLCLMHCDVDIKHLLTGMHLHVLRVNKTFLEISGFSEETVLNWNAKEAFSIIHPNDVLGFKVKLIKAFISKFNKPMTYVYRARRNDGSYLTVKIIITGVQQPDKSFMLITNYVVLDL